MLKYTYMIRLLVLLCVAVLVSTPDLVSAQGGLVACEGTDCSACNLVDMANTGIILLFGFVGMIFAVLMTIAGFGLVTSGGSQSALEAAKSKFQNAIIGLIIVMAAWLLVDTLLKSLLQGGDLGTTFTGWGPWSEVQCSDQTDTKPFYDLNSGAGGAPPVTGQGQVENSTTTSACTIPPLSEITDSLALSMEKGNSVIFNNPVLQKCAQKFISQVGGGAKINSAYRPEAYQKHLWEIRDRWCTKGLRANTDASCSALKTAIGGEVTKHFGSGWMCGAVGATSRHSQNSAVDIGGISNHADASVQAKANANCLVWKNYPGDPWHYDLKPGCTCD